MKKIEKLEEQPDKITPVLVEAVLMPQGEIISKGITIGWFKENEFIYREIE